MAPESNFEIMPQKYPKRMNHRKKRLLPLAVRALNDLMIFIGHEIPKLITIRASKNCPILSSFFI
jgi:hypothetical protein